MKDDKNEPNKMKRNHTFLTGMYIAVNAIKNSYLIMDGPDCAYKKVELLEKNHDFFSNIFQRNGKHKISATVVDVNHVIDERHENIIQNIIDVASCEDAQSVFISSEPMVALTGIDYDMLAGESQKKTNKEIISIPYQSLNKDWIDGYSYVLEKIAQKLELSSDKREKNTVAIVGFMFDRNEGDNLGNIDEITRLLNLLGLNVSSIWLSGSDFSSLKEIEKAEYIIKMPYAANSANIISQKTGAKIIETEIPFGIEGTKRWLMEIANELNIIEKTNQVIDNELKSIMPLFEWIVPTYFQDKKISFGGDPFLAKMIYNSFKDLDCRFKDFIIYSTSDRLLDISDNEVKFYYELDDIDNIETVDYAIGCFNSKEFFLRIPDANFVELGFPSHSTHFFASEPYLGFKGFAMLLNRMINVLLSKDR